MEGEKHILVVDRSVLARNIYKIIFSKFPAFVLHPVDSLEAVDNIIAEASSCHALIFNTNVVRRNAEQVQRLLVDMGPYNKLPKLVISGESTVQEWEDWCEEGLAVVLERPFHPDELILELKRLLNMR